MLFAVGSFIVFFIFYLFFFCILSFSNLSAIGSRMMTDDGWRHGISGRQSHLRQVARIARLLRRKSLHQSLQ